MKNVGPPWLSALTATSLSFLLFIVAILFFTDFKECKEWIYEITSNIDFLWSAYFKLKKECLQLIDLYLQSESKPLKVFVITIVLSVITAQFGISKEHKIKYTFSEMYESFWIFRHPYIKMKVIGFLVYSTYLLNIVLFFVSFYHKLFSPMILTLASIIILQLCGLKNLRDVKEWKMKLHYEDNKKVSQSAKN